MTKGKYAARAARTRIETADAHIDRLTNEVVEAKLRARQHEAAARELPGVRAELARLRIQIEMGTSDTLESERRRFEASLSKSEERAEQIASFLRLALDRSEEGPFAGFSQEEWGDLAEAAGPLTQFGVAAEGCRHDRRWQALGATSAEAFARRGRRAQEAQRMRRTNRPATGDLNVVLS